MKFDQDSLHMYTFYIKYIHNRALQNILSQNAEEESFAPDTEAIAYCSGTVGRVWLCCIIAGTVNLNPQLQNNDPKFREALLIKNNCIPFLFILESLIY